MMAKNEEGTQNILKEKVDNNDNTKENELHSNHSFKWRQCGRPNNITCSKAGTVLDSLKTSSQFREIAKKNNKKELVIMKDGKAISSHFPCILIGTGEVLTVKYVKAAGIPKKAISPVSRGEKSPSDLVMFHVSTRGGKNVKKIMRNPELKDIQDVTVYAYKGERVKDALRRDGRFHMVIFKKNCILFQRDTEVTTEFSNLVDDLDDRDFQIVLLNKSNPPDSQPGSLDDACVAPDESESHSDSKSGITQPDKDGNSIMTPDPVVESKRLREHLCSEFKKFLTSKKGNASRLSHAQKLLRVEFGQNAQMCNEVKTMKKLMDLSSSVCQVRINGDPVGSGFLLFGRHVLTNGHVIKNIYNEETEELYGEVSVHFSYENVEQNDDAIPVEEVVCFQYSPDGYRNDMALLKVSDNQELPSGLLSCFGFSPQQGGICIIGHPNGSVKKIDPCAIVPSQNRNQVVNRHYIENQGNIQLVTSSFFQDAAVFAEKTSLTYESCFSHGSSGSPVFDKCCNVVAVHTGGYNYPFGISNSVIEFGCLLSDLLECIIIQVVQKKKFDVLKEYLTCTYRQKEVIENNVKKLVESRNNTEFKEAISLMDKDDTSLKVFWSFFSQKEEPVPMETS